MKKEINGPSENWLELKKTILNNSYQELVNFLRQHNEYGNKRFYTEVKLLLDSFQKFFNELKKPSQTSGSSFLNKFFNNKSSIKSEDTINKLILLKENLENFYKVSQKALGNDSGDIRLLDDFKHLLKKLDNITSFPHSELQDIILRIVDIIHTTQPEVEYRYNDGVSTFRTDPFCIIDITTPNITAEEPFLDPEKEQELFGSPDKVYKA